MKKKINIKKLLKICKSEKDKKKILDIFKYRKKVFKENKFSKKDDIFKISFKNFKIFLNYKSSFSALEVFYEIFIENDHMNCDGFDGYHKKTIIDLGSHNGFYSMKLKMQNPNLKIFCYEANKREIKLAKMNFKINRLNKKVCLYNNFVSGSNKEFFNFNYIEELPAISGLSLKSSERNWLKKEFIKKNKVKNTNLNRIIRENKIKSIDILKIDVEGAELEIIKNFKYLKIVSKITLEFHSIKIRNELVKYLEYKNFRLIKKNENSQLNYGSMYFVNLDLKHD